MRTPEELRALVEAYLARSEHWQADGLGEAIRYPVGGGGKRLRPVLCLAVGEAVGIDAERLLPAATALELIHTFSLVHDDLPALDDDDERRGRASVHVRYGEGVAILAGDALLTKAFALAATYDRPGPAAVLADATLGMIEGQYLDITGAEVEVLELHRLKTAQLFAAAVRLPLTLIDRADEADWLAFGEAFGRLFQLCDDLADGDGAVERYGQLRTRELASDQVALASGALGRVDADPHVVQSLLDDLSAHAA